MKNFIREWWEILAAPLAIAVFIAYPYLLYDQSDINAVAGWSSIYLQKCLFAFLIIILANAIGYLLPRLDNEPDGDDNQLSEWEKRKSNLLRYAVLFLGFILAMQALGGR